MGWSHESNPDFPSTVWGRVVSCTPWMWEDDDDDDDDNDDDDDDDDNDDDYYYYYYQKVRT